MDTLPNEWTYFPGCPPGPQERFKVHWVWNHPFVVNPGENNAGSNMSSATAAVTNHVEDSSLAGVTFSFSGF